MNFPFTMLNASHVVDENGECCQSTDFAFKGLGIFHLQLRSFPIGIWKIRRFSHVLNIQLKLTVIFVL